MTSASSATIKRLIDSELVKTNFEKAKERALITCPLCRAGLEPIQLIKDEKGNQTVWWVCRNTFDNKCTFPGELPPEVFWIQRCAEDVELGIIPKPKAEKIPKRFRYLYPALFPQEDVNPPPPETAIPLSSEEIQGNLEATEPDTSLISHFGSYESRPPSACDTASVVSVAPVPVDSISGGSNSYSTGTSLSIASAPAGVVPGPSTSNESRKRPASASPSKVPNPRFREMVANHFLTLKEAGMDITKLKEIAQELVDQANDLEAMETQRKRLRIPLITQDEYTDTIVQNVPEVKREQVAQAVKQKILPQRLKIASLARNVSSGAELLKMIGLAGSPLPESNKWREETNQQVNLNLRNAARHTRKALEKRNRLNRPTPSPSPLTIEEPSQPSRNLENDEQRRKEEREVELKIKKFVSQKLRKIQEETKLKQKQAELEQKRRQEEEEALRISQQPILEPMPEASFQPLPEATRERLNSFSSSLAEYDNFSDPFHSYPPMDSQFPPLDNAFSTGDDAPLDDLFGNLNDLF